MKSILKARFKKMITRKFRWFVGLTALLGASLLAIAGPAPVQGEKIDNTAPALAKAGPANIDDTFNIAPAKIACSLAACSVDFAANTAHATTDPAKVFVVTNTTSTKTIAGYGSTFAGTTIKDLGGTTVNVCDNNITDVTNGLFTNTVNNGKLIDMRIGKNYGGTSNGATKKVDTADAAVTVENTGQQAAAG